MTTTTENHTTTAANGMTTDAGATLSRIGNSILAGLASIGEGTRRARQARRFAELHRMSDAQLQANGYNREDLAYQVFGPSIYL